MLAKSPAWLLLVSRPSWWVGCLLLSLSCLPLQAQNPDAASTEPTAQAELAADFTALLTAGATSAEIGEWQTAHAADYAAIAQSAEIAGEEAALQPLPIVVAAALPANATPALTSLLTQQQALARTQSEIHNDLLDTLPEVVSDAQFDQFQAEEQSQLAQAAGATTASQAQLAQTVADQSAQTPLPEPCELVISQDADPVLRTLLTRQDALARSWVHLSNQYLHASAAARQTAIEQWQRQTAPLLAQISQAAEDLASNPAE